MNPFNNFVRTASLSTVRPALPARARSIRIGFRWLVTAALVPLCLLLTACPGGIGAFLPFIAGISPNTVAAGGGSFAVVISGTGFASAVVLVNDHPVTVTSVTSTQVGATIPASLIASPGTLTVVMINVLPSGNVTSNSVVITVTGSSGVPVLNITKSHTGSFAQGQTGATYTVTVSNVSSEASTSGLVTVAEMPPTGLTVTAIAGNGTGWTCTITNLMCTRSDALAGGSSYPTITVTVSVATNAPSSVVNSVTVSGGGAATATTTDRTTITGGSGGTPALTLTMISGSPTFTAGGTGSYTFTVMNTGTAPTSGTVTLDISLDPNLIFPSSGVLNGPGWTCNPSLVECTISTPLPQGSSFGTVTMQFLISTSAPSSVTSESIVNGGGSSGGTAEVTTPVAP